MGRCLEAAGDGDLPAILQLSLHDLERSGPARAGYVPESNGGLIPC